MNASRHPTAFTVRCATPVDYAHILDVWRASGLSIEPRGRESEPAFRAQLERFGEHYWVATVQDRVVGVALGTHDLRKGWISRLAVRSEFRRCGIARALVEACERSLRGAGIDLICALVEPHNPASEALFRKLGFPSDIPVIYFRKPGPTPDS